MCLSQGPQSSSSVIASLSTEYSRNVVEDAHAPWIKEVCTVCTVVKWLKPVKNKAWRLGGMGGQLVLEGLQRCLAYCSLRELVPQDDGSWEEALLVSCV